MDDSKLLSYSTNAISDILPLDRETCKQMATYALSLRSDYEVSNYFLNLLGNSEASLKFLSKFTELKEEQEKAAKKQKAKEAKSSHEQIPRQQNTKDSSKGNAWFKDPGGEKSKAPKGGRLSDNKSAKLTSELIDSKPSNQVPSSQVKKAKKKNIDNLKDIESVINELELDSINEREKNSAHVQRKCNCMGMRHPLFEIAPNCLNCGKIICVLEGLQPCSFCGKDILSYKDRLDILAILKKEKDLIENKQSDTKNRSLQQQPLPTSQGKQKSKKITVTMNAGENLWKAQDEAFRKVEEERKKEMEERGFNETLKELARSDKSELSLLNPELDQAQERLERLLDFQSTGAERTKIIDKAADYEVPVMDDRDYMWLSPVERALQLKKQQRKLRKHEEAQSKRTGRGNKTVEMVIKDGKVKMVEKYVPANEDEKDDDIALLEEEVKEDRKRKDEGIQKFWDYEKDKERWQNKPSYLHPDKRISNNQTSLERSRIQFDSDNNTESVILSIAY